MQHLRSAVNKSRPYISQRRQSARKITQQYAAHAFIRSIITERCMVTAGNLFSPESLVYLLTGKTNLTEIEITSPHLQTQVTDLALNQWSRKPEGSSRKSNVHNKPWRSLHGVTSCFLSEDGRKEKRITLEIKFLN